MNKYIYNYTENYKHPHACTRLRINVTELSSGQVIAITTGTNILVRIRPAPKTAEENRQQNKPKLKYCVMNKKTDDAPASTRSGQPPVGPRHRNVAGSSNQVAAEPGDVDSEAPRAKIDHKVTVVGTASESPVEQDGGGTTPVEDTAPVEDATPVVDTIPVEDTTPVDDTTPVEDTTPVVTTSESPVRQDGARDDDADTLVTDEDIDTAATPDSATGGNESVA